MSRIHNGTDLCLDFRPFSGTCKAIVHDHVNLFRTVLHIIAYFKLLDCSRGFSMREIQYCTDTCFAVTAQFHSKWNV